MLVIVWGLRRQERKKTWLSHMNFAYGLAHYILLIIKFSVAQWKSNIQMIEARILIGTQGRLLVFILSSRWLAPRDILSYDWMIALILALRHSIEKHSVFLSLPIGHCDDRFTTFSWTVLKQWKLITSWVPRMLALQPIRLFCSLSRCAPWETTHFKPGSCQSIVTWVRTTCLWFVFRRLPRLSMQPWV